MHVHALASNISHIILSVVLGMGLCRFILYLQVNTGCRVPLDMQ